jgi:hypothetical protein
MEAFGYVLYIVVFDQKKVKFFFSCNFFLQIVVIKTLDPDQYSA